MIGVVATLKIAPGKEAEFEASANQLAAKVNANEEGAMLYELYRSKADPSIFIFMEKYASAEAFAAHGKTDYFLAAQPGLGACLSAAPDIQVFDKAG